MHNFFVILLTMAIQTGLFARLAPEGEFCLQSGVEDCPRGASDHSHDPCDHTHPCPDDDECPLDGKHHHHHGSCVHSLQLTFGGEGSCKLTPPFAVSLGREAQQRHAPDGPVRDLDKPPLI